MTFFRSALTLGSGASRGLGGSRLLSCSRLTGLRASTSSSGTPLSPPRAADSCERLGNGCGEGAGAVIQTYSSMQSEEIPVTKG